MGLSCNSAFTLAPTSALFSRGQQFCGVLIYALLLLLQFRDGPQSSIRGRTTWLMSDVGNGGPDVGIVHQLFVRLTLGTGKLAGGVGGLNRVSWCRSNPRGRRPYLNIVMDSNTSRVEISPLATVGTSDVHRPDCHRV